MEPVTLKLSPDMLAALRQIAQAEDTTIGAVMRDAVTRDLRRRARAKKAVGPDERLVGPLRALLADDFAYSNTWAELQSRLGTKGYALAEAGGGLILTDRNGTRLCKASDLGYAFGRLLTKFDAPFPGHGHNWRLRQIRAVRRV